MQLDVVGLENTTHTQQSPHLDHDHVIERVAMIETAAGAHCHLVEQPKTGRRFASVQQSAQRRTERAGRESACARPRYMAQTQLVRSINSIGALCLGRGRNQRDQPPRRSGNARHALQNVECETLACAEKRNPTLDESMASRHAGFDDGEL